MLRLYHRRHMRIRKGQTSARVADAAVVEDVQMFGQAFGTEIERVVVGEADQIDADPRDLPSEVARHAEVVERTQQFRLGVDRELHVAVGDIRLLHQSDQLASLGCVELTDRLVEDHVADRRDHHVAGFFLQQGVDPRHPVDLGLANRRVHAMLIDGGGFIPCRNRQRGFTCHRMTGENEQAQTDQRIQTAHADIPGDGERPV